MWCQLSTLALENINDAALYALSFNKWSTLQTLRMATGTLTVKGLKSLAKAQLPYLKMLSLGKVTFAATGDEKPMAELAKGIWPLLQTLELWHIGLTSTNIAPWFEQLTSGDWPCLTELTLVDACIGYEHVHALMKADWPALNFIALVGDSDVNTLQHDPPEGFADIVGAVTTCIIIWPCLSAVCFGARFLTQTLDECRQLISVQWPLRKVRSEQFCLRKTFISPRLNT